MVVQPSFPAKSVPEFIAYAKANPGKINSYAISSPKSALFLANAGAVSQAVALRGHAVKPVNDCAQCGADIIAPEWSEHLSDRRVRNVWSCADCRYQFEDVVYLSARELIEDD